ncbi:MAG TPA: glutathione S-transferase family protein [Gaiellales bacterium]|nr:glutathione S-transferase family protein [Gaiellales bacterium]
MSAAVLALYDHPISGNAQKVRFLLAELGLEYERRGVPIERPRPQWYADINPLMGIPTLQDGDLVLSESQAILRYLANRERRDDLYPADPPARARVDMMLDRFAFAFRPALFQVEAQALGFSPTGGFGAAPADPEAAVAKARDAAPVLTQFESVVDPSGYWLGEFSLADVAAAPFLYRTLVTGMDLSPYPNLARMRDTVTARPAFAAVEPEPRAPAN